MYSCWKNPTGLFKQSLALAVTCVPIQARIIPFVLGVYLMKSFVVAGHFLPDLGLALFIRNY